MKRALLIGLLFSTVSAVAATKTALKDQDAIRALIGEAGGQSDRTLLAVAGAIRNRGTLQGVYGLDNPAALQASARLRARAARAWSRSRTVRLNRAKYFGGAGDADYFLNALHYHPVATEGDITFYQP